MKKNKFIFILLITVFIIVAIILGYLFIDTDDYLQSETFDNRVSIVYNNCKYYKYDPQGTRFYISKNINGKVIGYTRNLYGHKSDAYLISNTNDNILITQYNPNNYYLDGYIWLKEDFVLPNIFEATINKIIISYSQQKEVWESNNYITLNQLIDKNKRFDSLNEINSSEIAYFIYSETPSLNIVVFVYYTNNGCYLSYVDNSGETVYYAISNEFTNIFTSIS